MTVQWHKAPEATREKARNSAARQHGYPVFGLVLMVTHACNMRCSYCYTGRKSDTVMSVETGIAAIDRALASILEGGTLELGFFGGEPLLEPALVSRLLEYARRKTREYSLGLSVSLTTNGTINEGKAWKLLTDPGITVSISCDGAACVHDAHRRYAGGAVTWNDVRDTIVRLAACGRPPEAAAVVRPDTVDKVVESLEALLSMGVTRIALSLDLWAEWTPENLAMLEAAVAGCADFWAEHLPGISIGWYDEKAALLAGLPIGASARCGFGAGEVAVAPSGRIYPCERLIHEDRPGNPWVLPVSLAGCGDFLSIEAAPGRSEAACGTCRVFPMCGTTCRCSNIVRTGDASRPDGLLCSFEKARLRETARVLKEASARLAASNERKVPQ
ncbi:MAG: radical SAM protein [Planctomycetes bacterium]|nr:radical SAM protein [Planctomycetota bacterium]